MYEMDIPKDSIIYWQELMSINWGTQKEINITSYGEWDFNLSRKRKQQIARPIEQIVKQLVGQGLNQFIDEIQDDQQIKQISELPEFKNVKEALSNIDIQINYTDEQFKQNYGFWEIKNFKVYNRCVKSSQCLLEDDQYYYFGTYGTQQ